MTKTKFVIEAIANIITLIAETRLPPKDDRTNDFWPEEMKISLANRELFDSHLEVITSAYMDSRVF